MKKIFDSIVFSGADTPKYSSCTFPGICTLSDGRIFASFKAAPKKGPLNKGETVLLCISEDFGKTWGEPAEIFEAPVIDGKKTTLRTLYFIEWTKGKLMAVLNAVDATMELLPYYNEETEGLKDTYILVAHSDDMGKSWSPMERVFVKTFGDVPLPLTGAPFLTKDGKIGIQFEVNKPYYEEEYWVHHSAVIYSSDGGKTWGDEVVITDSREIYYWDQRMSALADGRVADIFWTFDRNLGDYINIHMCMSEDNGKSFGKMTDTGLSGQPGNVINGRDGKLLTGYINRDASPVIRMAECDNKCLWKDALTVYDSGLEKKNGKNTSMNDVWAEMGAFSVGHPFLLPINEDNVLVYYYSGTSTDRTDICCVMINIAEE